MPEAGQPCKEALTFHVGLNGGDVEPFDLVEEKGALFSDGSCYAGSVEAAARAGWSIIELVEQELKMIRAKYGNIRAGSPQTAVMGGSTQLWWRQQRWGHSSRGNSGGNHSVVSQQLLHCCCPRHCSCHHHLTSGGSNGHTNAHTHH